MSKSSFSKTSTPLDDNAVGEIVPDDIRSLCEGKTKNVIGELVDNNKAYRKRFNETTTKCVSLLKSLQAEKDDFCSFYENCEVAKEYNRCLLMMQQVHTQMEKCRKKMDDRIYGFREMQKVAVDKYGNKRSPLMLTEEEQELTYELKASAMRDTYQQTTQLKKELELNKLLKAKEKSFVSNNTVFLSKSQLVHLNNYYKKQLAELQAKVRSLQQAVNDQQAKMASSAAASSSMPNGRLPELTPRSTEDGRRLHELRAALRESRGAEEELLKQMRRLEVELAAAHTSALVGRRREDALRDVCRQERQRADQLGRQLTTRAGAWIDRLQRAQRRQATSISASLRSAAITQFGASRHDTFC